MEFLNAITPSEALRIIGSFPVSPSTETIHIEEALGRVLALDIVSGEDIPPFQRSLVDGYALRAKDTYGAKETSPSLLAVKGEVRVGEETGLALEDGSTVYLSTGAMVPEGADGVVMQEFVRRAGDAVEVTRGVVRGENICFRGEDVEKGATVAQAGTRIAPSHMGTLAALGLSRVPVYGRPAVSLMSSGDEVVAIDTLPPLGKIRDINRFSLTGLLGEEGASVTFRGIAADRLEGIMALLLASRESDLILISGGSSKGERDYVSNAIESLGGKVLFHGINIKPGKPTIFAELWGKPLFGLPGHPASCMLATTRFVLPLLSKLKGETAYRPRKVRATLTTNIPSSYGIEEYVRAALEEDESGLRAIPIFSKSAVISSLSEASGYLIIPEGKEGCEKGEEVEVYLFG
jgi:molybdopterin molybdotransferase